MSQPKPLGEFSLVTPEGDQVSLRMEQTLKVNESERVTVTARGDPIPLVIDRRVERVEQIREGYYLESTDRSKYFIFISRDAVADYMHSQREGRAEYKQSLEAWEAERAETQASIEKAEQEIAKLEKAVASADQKFLDSEGNLAYMKAKSDLAMLEKRVKDLRPKLGRPRPEMSLGSAISTQFGADSILEKRGIVAEVKAERASLLSVYGGFPEQSEISLAPRVKAVIKWKR